MAIDFNFPRSSRLFKQLEARRHGSGSRGRGDSRNRLSVCSSPNSNINVFVVFIFRLCSSRPAATAQALAAVRRLRRVITARHHPSEQSTKSKLASPKELVWFVNMCFSRLPVKFSKREVGSGRCVSWIVRLLPL